MANFPIGFSEINRALVDGDDVFVGNRRAQLSRFWTYVSAKLLAQTNYVTSAMLRNSSALSVLGRAANSVGVPADIAAIASSDGVLRELGGVLGFGTVAAGGIADGAIIASKIASGAVSEAKLSSALLAILGALVDTADPLSVFPSYHTIAVTSRFTDFDTTSTGNYPYSAFGSGAGNGQNWSAAVAGRKGLVTLETGTATNGQYYVGTNTAAIALGNGKHTWRSDMYIPVASDGTDTFVVRAGFIDSTGGECIDGCYFRCAHNVNGGRWEFVTRSNNVESGSATDTGVAGVAPIASMEIEANPAGTQVVARINGAVVATNTTNIPTGPTRATGVGISITKSAGTTNRTVIVDNMGDRFERSVAI